MTSLFVGCTEFSHPGNWSVFLGEESRKIAREKESSKAVQGRHELIESGRASCISPHPTSQGQQ